MKNQLKLMVSKKLLIDLTSAQTFKVWYNLSHIFRNKIVTTTLSEIIEGEYTVEPLGGQQSIITGFTGTLDKTNGTNISTNDPVLF